MKDYEDMTLEELIYEYEKFVGRQTTKAERVLLAMMHTEIIDAYKRGFVAGTMNGAGLPVTPPAGVHSTREAARNE
ncbi:hypothetical protein A5N82_12930 [Christensenella minuta]|uniref:Uncharacterized protein n=1 Tax=Christensenella minuta TaxID=626937 RepID=A0A136Q8G5_9FIRM|nr:hypothetical protein [Christensenella minuta]AYH41303.1 hypothetical protein B1H56_12710 [Christensenella minuta]AYH41338.1 hypothetical protein B1H56_12900 [Christensenella minuta]KXK66960.1 hypothetical protein HMPREF3293_00172 [Christensenella minuta]OAQ39358.1 hypothetical protein A5N82_12930 [Christensenella minuta]